MLKGLTLKEGLQKQSLHLPLLTQRTRLIPACMVVALACAGRCVDTSVPAGDRPARQRRTGSPGPTLPPQGRPPAGSCQGSGSCSQTGRTYGKRKERETEYSSYFLDSNAEYPKTTIGPVIHNSSVLETALKMSILFLFFTKHN